MNIRVTLIAALLAAVGIVAGSAHATPPGERFVLTGVVYVEGGRGLAWLQEPTFTNNQVITVRLGDNVGPYRVTKILEDQVELEGPGGKVSVPLAGGSGAISVAAIPGVRESSGEELPPHNGLKNPDEIVIARGDPGRNFPTADFLVGAGARIRGAASDVPEPQVSEPQAVTPPPFIQIPSWMQTAAPQLPPHNALKNPDAIVIPRGDPRRNFPAADFLLGAR